VKQIVHPLEDTYWLHLCESEPWWIQGTTVTWLKITLPNDFRYGPYYSISSSNLVQMFRHYKPIGQIITLTTIAVYYRYTAFDIIDVLSAV